MLLLLRRLERMAVGFQAKRLDIVADTYQDYSIKNTTRQARGMGKWEVYFSSMNAILFQTPEAKKMTENFQQIRVF